MSHRGDVGQRSHYPGQVVRWHHKAGQRATSSIANAKKNSVACCCVWKINEMSVPQPICTNE